MPEKKTIERARRDKAEGKAASTQAGEFVREEIEHVREGKHGVRSAKQAIAIGLSKARRAGVNLPAPPPGKISNKARKNAQRAYARGHGATAARPPSARRARAARKALEREDRSAASTKSLRAQARVAATHRTARERSDAAKEASRTKGPARRKAAARKAARTRGRRKMLG
jgi:Family of unknown function (DUF6496)